MLALLDIPELPCIPMQAGHTHSSLHISAINVFQVLGEADAVLTARALLDSVKSSLSTLEEYWKGKKEWWDLSDKLSVFRGMIARLFYVTNFFAGLPLSQSRNPISMLEELKKGPNDSFVEDLGRFQRSAMLAVAKYRADSPPKDDGSNDDLKGPAGKYLSARLYSGMGKTFKCEFDGHKPETDADSPAFIRLLFHKRSPEPAHRKAAEMVAKSITKTLIEHAEEARLLDGAVNTVYSTIVLGSTLSQLFDERGHEGHLHMILFLTFEKRNGLGHMLDLVDSLLDAMDGTITDVGTRPQIIAGVTVAVELLSALVRPKAIMSNPQTQALLQRTEYNFSPAELFIRLRRDIFPYAHRVWTAEWLGQAPLKIAQRGIKAFLTIMGGKDEEPVTGQPIPLRTGAAGIQAPVVRLPAVADPAAIDQLVDMGFPRASAEQALIRARNNVAAAADMILSMPHVFEAAATAAAAAAPAAPPAVVPAPPANPEVDFAAVLVDALMGAGVGADGVAAAAPAAPAIDTAVAAPLLGEALPINNDGSAGESMDVDPSKTPSPIEPPEAVKKELDGMRAKHKDEMPVRAMSLLAASDKMLFDLIPAFPTDQTGLAALVKDFDPEADATLIANRLKLFALLVHDRDIPDLSEENANAAFNVIKVLPIDATPRPPWITSLLLFAETVMLMTTNTNEVKIGDEPTATTSSIRREEEDRLVTACSGIFADTEATRDELVSAYRCMVLLTKSTRSIDFANCIAPFKHKLDAKLSSCHSTLAMILRHSFEDEQTLREVMRREVRNWFAKDKVTDMNHFVRQLRQATARDSDAFVDAVEKECALLDPKPVSTIYHIRAKEPEKAAASDPFQGGSSSHPAMDLLVRELGTASKATLKDEAITEGYTGLLFSLITEVTGSYISAKKAFMEALREIGLNGPKSRNGIAPIINDLVGCVELGRDLAQEGQALKNGNLNRQKTVSGWAVSMLVALCSDITATSDAKNVPEDLTTIRRTVLDAIVKVLKDSASQDPSVRYGKLWAIGEVVYRLLTAKSSIGPPRNDDSTLQIAKAMVEKNFVGLMTDAMGNVDLNYPNVKVALLSVLRALEHL
jgi:E3 ubiquitin-protein ligase HUWE1